MCVCACVRVRARRYGKRASCEAGGEELGTTRVVINKCHLKKEKFASLLLNQTIIWIAVK